MLNIICCLQSLTSMKNFDPQQKKHFFSITGKICFLLWYFTLCKKRMANSSHAFGKLSYIFEEHTISHCLYGTVFDPVSLTKNGIDYLLPPLTFISPQFFSARRQGRWLCRLTLALGLVPVCPTLPQCWRVCLASKRGALSLWSGVSNIIYSRLQNRRVDS